MLFWVREVAGWILIVVALAMIQRGITFVADPEAPRIVEAGVVLFAATGVMRVGVMLIRVATAARIVDREDKGMPLEADAG